ncbi:hypothetical protein [Dapis sp. BLCC M229]|uniref:hypothetical protein n=1 Tax=Dapis sp. BLCC M229 TaxID=3400188 RepID=UPI003CF8E2C6
MSTRKAVDALYKLSILSPLRRLGYRLNRSFNYLTMLGVTYQDSGYIVAWFCTTNYSVCHILA